MLNNDAFIFDDAVHIYDSPDANIRRSDGHVDRASHLRFGHLGRLLFAYSSTDTAMAHAVGLGLLWTPL